MKIDECRMLRAFKQCRESGAFSSCPGLLRSNRQRLTWLEMFTLRSYYTKMFAQTETLGAENKKPLTNSNAISQWFKEHD